MAKFRLYCGIVKDDKWYNYTEVNALKGGVLALMDSGEKTGAARLLNLLKGSVTKFYTEDDQELVLSEKDYLEIDAADAWQIGYEQIKNTTGETHPIVPEYFYCSRCSRQGEERYTKVEESWQTLIDEGIIIEMYLDNGEKANNTFTVELPTPITIEAKKTVLGGTFDSIVMKRITVGDMIKIQRMPDATKSEASLIYASWDTMIAHIPGISDKDLNILKRTPGTFFSKEYFVDNDNVNAIMIAENENVIGLNAECRSVICQHCGNEIGGGIDQTNFFSPLLPKKLSRNSGMKNA